MTAGNKLDISIVVLTYNRCSEVLNTLEKLCHLPERVQVVAVDNGSTDQTAEEIKNRFPCVHLIKLPANIGAAARNAGLEAVTSSYVAFSDDDTLWTPGSLSRACELLDNFPRVAVLSARVLNGEEQIEDSVCEVMASSPLGSERLPGPSITGFLAGACVFRREAFLQAGGYEPKFFLGGEEALLAYDLMSLGWVLVYTPQLTVLHFPSESRDIAGRNRLLLRNRLWVAWMRRPASVALRETVKCWTEIGGGRSAIAGYFDAAFGLPWVLARRRILPPQVEAKLLFVEMHGQCIPRKSAAAAPSMQTAGFAD